ncbi:MAG: helix-turn-helix transcriptional regulator [Clostridia bacterium]|nr:helix-turn-helix transcriptional regulator [Clostridia bacterium]
MLWKSYLIKEQIKIDRFYSAFRRYYGQGYGFKGEIHNFWECLYVISGSLQVSADERIYNMSAGDIIFHMPLELHKFTVLSENGADIFVFSFSLEGAMAHYMEKKLFTLNDREKRLIGEMLEYMEQGFTKVCLGERKFSYKQYIEPMEILPLYSQTVVAYLYRLILFLIDENGVTAFSTEPDAEIFKKAVDFMVSNICGKLSVGDFARHCNVSEAGIKRIFAKYSGVGVHKYFLTLKIKTATELLNSGMSVGQVAEKLGFSSQGYFSATFKRETGELPSEYFGR